MKYQTVVSMKHPRILLVSTGFPGSKHDLTISSKTGLIGLLIELNETCIGDKAYQGPPVFITPYKNYNNIELTIYQEIYNQLLEKFRNNVERINKRLKIYQCLKQQWRHPIEKHALIFHVVSILTNISLSYRPLNDDDDE